MTDHPSLEDFDWPCDRRDAHGPHAPAVRNGGIIYDCPGVPAHPATQIGGDHR